MIQHRSMLQCAVTTYHVSGTMVYEHTSRTVTIMHKMWMFTVLKPYFCRKNCEAIPDSSWRTDTYNCESSSHQVKSDLTSQNCQVISGSILCLSQDIQWLLLCSLLQLYGWNSNTNSLHNAWRTELYTSSEYRSRIRNHHHHIIYNKCVYEKLEILEIKDDKNGPMIVTMKFHPK